MNRLKRASQNSTPGTIVMVGKSEYLESFDYDKHGNITELKRYTKNKAVNISASAVTSPVYIYRDQLLDNLLMDYNGNQLLSVSDPQDHYQTDIKEYHDVNTGSADFAYDANGNMIEDKDRGISEIQYNLLNLPERIIFDDGHEINNLYTSDGRKLSTRHLSKVSNIALPIIVSPGQLFYTVSGMHYVGNKEYELTGEMHQFIGLPDEILLKRVHNSEGYADGNGKYNYYRRDHLGNNREVWQVDGNNISTIQRTNYYPSGLPWAYQQGDGASLQPYKHNGTEFIEMHGYDVSDHGNRGLRHATNLYTTMDRFAEKFPWQSPYVHAGNNPVNYVDVNGDSIKFYIWEGVGYGAKKTDVSFSQLDENIQKALVLVGKSTAGYNFFKQFATKGDSFGSKEAGGIISFSEDGENSKHNFYVEQMKSEGGDFGTADIGPGGNYLWFNTRINTERSDGKTVENYASTILHEMFIHLNEHSGNMINAYNVNYQEYKKYRSTVYLKDYHPGETDHRNYINGGTSYKIIRSVIKQYPQLNNTFIQHDKKYNNLKKR